MKSAARPAATSGGCRGSTVTPSAEGGVEEDDDVDDDVTLTCPASGSISTLTVLIHIE